MCSFGSIKRFALSLCLILTSLLTFGQDLFWVGTSGSFNDPNHWSLTKNGPAAGIIPTKNTTIHFEKEEAGTIVINFVGATNFKKLQILNSLTQYHFIFSNFSETSIWGDFELAPNSKISGSGKFIFNNEGALSKVNFLNQVYAGNIYFKGGNWQIKSINTSDDKSVILEGGNFNLNNSRINTGNFISNSGNVVITNNTSVLDVKNSFEIGNTTQFNSNGLYVKTPLDAGHYKVASGVNFGSNYKTLNSTFAVCGATLSSVGISCSGVCDGTLVLNIDPTCPGAPYNLIWSNPSCALPTLNNVGPGTHTITGLCACADFYSVLVFDNIGNLLTISNQVNIPGQSAINFVPIAFVQPVCNGDCNGSITANLSGSVGPYTVTINGSSVVPVPSGNTTYSMLCGGTNSFSVIDTKGCVRNFTVNLNQPTTLTLTSVTSSLNCNGVCNGSIVINPIGGTPNYTVVSSIPTSSTVSTGGSVALTGLCQGVVTTTITDFKGCIRTSTFTINQPPTFTATSTQTNVTCFGSCTGIGSVTPSGGTAPYTFTWNPGGNNSPINSTLCAGVNTVTIRDLNNCTLVQTLTITQSPSVTISTTQTNVLCNAQCNGAASVTASGGAGAFTFTWVAPGNTTISTTQSAAGLCAGAYTVFVRDLNNCLTQSVVTITQPPALTITAQTQSIQCFGVCSGAATVITTGGNGAPFNATWTPSGSGTISNALCAGSYTVAITDASACPISTVFTIAQPASITINASTTSLSCNGVCNGSISFTATGGLLPLATPTLMTPTGSIVGNPPYNALCAGNYTIIVRDASNCVQTTTLNLAQPPLLTSNVVTNSVTCFGACNGTLSGSAAGGTPSYTLSWLTATSVIPGGTVTGACAGTYTFQIVDASGCASNSVVTLNQPLAISTTINATSPLCFAGCNGSLNATVSGGVPGYTLNWSNGFTGNPNTGLCAGPYTLTVNDANNCSANFTTNVLAPSAMTINVATSSVTCFGSCNGSASVTVSGGAPGYTMTFNTLPIVTNTTGIVGGLCAGPFTVSVNDANGCVQTQNFTIAQPSSITINVSTTSLSCNGVCNGSISFTTSGGTAPIATPTLLTPTGTIVGNPPYNALCAGVYTIIIRDASNCLQTTTVNLAQPNLLTSSIATNSVTCFNACNGSLSGSAVGGTPSYTLSWLTATSVIPGGIVAGACAGTYTFQILDANGCTSNSVVTVNQPPAITTTINATSPICFAGCNGVLNANVSGGVPGYTLNWSNGFTGNPNTGLCAGGYTLTVNDANGCTSNFTAAVLAPPPMTINVATSSVTCAGNCNGSASVTVLGGTPNYTMNFNTIPIVTNTTGIVGGLCAGPFIVSVNDANGCVQNQNFIITQPIALSAAITGTQNSCNACTGAGTVTASNGTPPYSYSWTNSLSVVVSSSSVAINLCPGNYTATVTDSQGCTATVNHSVSQVVTVIVVASGTAIPCFGVCSASAQANAIGGTLPYTYTWNVTAPTQTTQTAVNLCAGNYTVTVSDALGCANTATVNFANPPAIVIAPTQTNLTCFGICNGVLNSNASGGTGALTYTWLPGGQNTSSITGQCAGNYTVIVRDANNCTQTATMTLTQPPQINAVLNATNPNACIVNNGSICATPSGGSGPVYTFTWSPAGGTGINSNCYSNLGAGLYSVVVADNVGCTRTFTASLSSPSGPTLTINTSSINCFGGSTGSATVTASGTPAFTFTWTPAVAFVNIGNTSTATGMTSGTYNIGVTDGNGCIVNQTVGIIQSPSLNVNSSVSNALCNTSCNGSITLSTSGGTPTYTFSWLPAIPPITGQGTQTVTNLCAGNYTVNITDAASCIVTRTFAITQPAAINFTVTPTNLLCNGVCNGSITTLVNGGTGPYTFTWTPVGGFLGAITPTIVNLCANVYTLTITDANLCIRNVTAQVTQPTALTSTVNFLSATCSNSCNGTATITASGGTPTYSFSWSSSPSTSSIVSTLCAGNVVATVSDGNGCTSNNSFTITAPPIFSLNLSPFNPLCNAACNGSISTTTVGAQGAVSYVWNPAGSGQNPTGLCAGNYTVIATDGAGCIANSAVILNNPPAVLANVTFTNPACNSNCNGIAVSTPTNVVGAVNYTWLPSGTTTTLNTINGQCAGNYTVQIQDANGCVDLQTYTLTNPPILTVNSSVGPSACAPPSGSITVLATGGTPSYTYTWLPPVVSTSSVLTGLTAGVYTVVVNDANNCTNTVSIPVSSSNGPSSAAITATNITCNGLCNGSASVTTITGGTPGYTISWVSPPAPSSANPISGLCAGNYTAQITDANNCILFAGVTITQPASLTISPSFTLPTCAGICNGSIILNPSGGVGPFNYTWTPAAPNTATLNSLCTGNYSVQIADANNCISTQSISFPAFTNIAALTTATNNLCFGNCNGSVNVAGFSGGLPPYTINWNTGQTTGFINSLCNGTYSATVNDNQGCTNTFTALITSPTAITATTSASQPSCGMCNGSSTVVAGGGVGPYTLSWTNGSSGTTASSLCAGIYQVNIVDFNGCSSLQNVLINSSSGITGQTFNNQNVLCAGNCNGSTTVTPIGGTAPITYSWVAPSSTNSFVSGLCPGNYFVQMTDAQGCIRTASTTINAATTLTLTPSVVNPSCAATNGSINVNVTGGTGPYTYTWLPGGASTSSLTNLGVGSYTLLTQDNNGCASSQQFNLTNPAGPALSFTQTNINCFNACTGSIVVVGTSTSLPITYNWSNGSTSQTVTGLCNGVITLTVSAGGCITIRSFTITQNPQLNLSLSNINDPRCNNDCNGSVTLIPFGGTLPYTFSWNTVPTSSLNPQTALCSGTYIATVTDNRGCTRTQTVSLQNPTSLTVTNTFSNSTCSNSNDGSATVTVSGGTPTYNILWNGPSTFTSSSTTLSNIPIGTYTATVVDSRSCASTSTLQIIPTTTLVAITNTPSACIGNSVVLSGTNSIGANTYNWFLLPDLVNPVSTNSVFTIPFVTNTSSYVLQVISTVTTCIDTRTVVVTALPFPIVNAGPSFTIPVFSSVTIGGSPTSPTALSYTWTPPFTLDNSTIPNPTASNTVNTIYTVTVQDANGCIASSTVGVDIYPEIDIPNGFSPNNDGKNDLWIIDNIEQFTDCTVEVYNRWGEQLFFNRGYTRKFDGKYNGKDLPVGTYYYVINLNHPVYPKPYTGPLTIFR